MKQIELDTLEILKSEARLSTKDIAERIGTSTNEVVSILKKLEKNKTILRYITVIDQTKLPKGKGSIRALIEVSIRPEKKRGFDGIARRLCQYPNVIDLYLISGNFDFLLIVEGNSLEEIAQFVSQKLASIENVRSTGTHFILKKYKENGIVINQEPQEKRLAVSL